MKKGGSDVEVLRKEQDGNDILPEDLLRNHDRNRLFSFRDS